MAGARIRGTAWGHGAPGEWGRVRGGSAGPPREPGAPRELGLGAGRASGLRGRQSGGSRLASWADPGAPGGPAGGGAGGVAGAGLGPGAGAASGVFSVLAAAVLVLKLPVLGAPRVLDLPVSLRTSRPLTLRVVGRKETVRQTALPVTFPSSSCFPLWLRLGAAWRPRELGALLSFQPSVPTRVGSRGRLHPLPPRVGPARPVFPADAPLLCAFPVRVHGVSRPVISGLALTGLFFLVMGSPFLLRGPAHPQPDVRHRGFLSWLLRFGRCSVAWRWSDPFGSGS